MSDPKTRIREDDMNEPIEQKPERRKFSKYITHAKENPKPWTLGIIASIATLSASYAGTKTLINSFVSGTECVSKNVVLVPTGKPRKTQVQNSVDVSGQT